MVVHTRLLVRTFAQLWLRLARAWMVGDVLHTNMGETVADWFYVFVIQCRVSALAALACVRAAFFIFCSAPPLASPADTKAPVEGLGTVLGAVR